MFDAHVHIIDPRFPLVTNAGFVPGPFTLADYERAVDGLGVTGGALVGASYNGDDDAFMVTLLGELGPTWVGVVELPEDATDEQILRLDRAGVRAVRFNLRRGAADITRLTSQAVRAHELAGWHSEFHVDAQLLRTLEPIMVRLPAVSIDYLGMSDEALPYLLDLVARGVRVKATGFGRIDLDPLTTMRAIHAVDPTALMFGTDLPGTRARRPFEPGDLEIVADAVGGDLQAVLFQNARAFYRMSSSGFRE